MTCTECGTELPDGEWAACRVESRCLEHCSDFAAHCTMPDDEVVPPDDEEDREYDRAVDDAVGEAADAGDIHNWRAYLKGGA